MQMELETENKEGLGMSFQRISTWRAELVITHENLGIEGAIFLAIETGYQVCTEVKSCTKAKPCCSKKIKNVSRPNGIFEANRGKRFENADRRNQGV